MLYEKIDHKINKNDENGIIELLPLIPHNEESNIACILEVSIYKKMKSVFNYILDNYNIEMLNKPHENFYDAIFNSDFNDIKDFFFFTNRLLKKGVDIYQPNEAGETFIENIIFSEDSNKYQLLDNILENNVEIKSNPLKERTLLVRVTPYKNLFKYLFDNCPNLISEKNNKGNSFFITAVQNKKHDLIKDIVDNNIMNINDRGYAETTPIMFAVLNQDKKMIEILLKGGADPYLSNTKGLDVFSLQQTLHTGFISKRQNSNTVKDFNDYILSIPSLNKKRVQFK